MGENIKQANITNQQYIHHNTYISNMGTQINKCTHHQHMKHDIMTCYMNTISQNVHRITDKLMQINMNTTGRHDTDQHETQHGIYYMKS